jgi:hypothetical protein
MLNFLRWRGFRAPRLLVAMASLVLSSRAAQAILGNDVFDVVRNATNDFRGRHDRLLKRFAAHCNVTPATSLVVIQDGSGSGACVRVCVCVREREGERERERQRERECVCVCVSVCE